MAERLDWEIRRLPTRSKLNFKSKAKRKRMVNFKYKKQKLPVRYST